jgi:hypothetical protein
MISNVASCGQDKWSLIPAIGKMFFFYQNDSSYQNHVGTSRCVLMRTCVSV